MGVHQRQLCLRAGRGREQARQIGSYLGVPASSTSLAFVKALQTLGINRVAVAATYPEELAAAFVDFLGQGGIHVVQLDSLGIWTAVEVGAVGPEQVIEFVRANDHPEADAILIPDTALHTIGFLPALDEVAGKPVLTANQVTMWQALQLGGGFRRAKRFRPTVCNRRGAGRRTRVKGRFREYGDCDLPALGGLFARADSHDGVARALAPEAADELPLFAFAPRYPLGLERGLTRDEVRSRLGGRLAEVEQLVLVAAEGADVDACVTVYPAGSEASWMLDWVVDPGKREAVAVDGIVQAGVDRIHHLASKGRRGVGDDGAKSGTGCAPAICSIEARGLCEDEEILAGLGRAGFQAVRTFVIMACELGTAREPLEVKERVPEGISLRSYRSGDAPAWIAAFKRFVFGPLGRVFIFGRELGPTRHLAPFQEGDQLCGRGERHFRWHLPLRAQSESPGKRGSLISTFLAYGLSSDAGAWGTV